MLVKVTSETSPYKFARWWYWTHIGETFRVELDPERDEYYIAHVPCYGVNERRHILKCDTEIVTDWPKAPDPSESPSAAGAEPVDGEIK